MQNNATNKRKLLFISAHPDDNSMIGGTMMKLAKNGWDVFEFVCSSGKTGKPNSAEAQGAMAENREDEINRFASAVGMEKPVVYENGKEFLILDEAIIVSLVAYMRTTRPDVIVLLNSDDYHFEHRLAHDIGLRAAEIAFRSQNLELGPKLTGGVILKTDGLNVLANPLIHFNTSDVYEQALKAYEEAYGERLGDLMRFSRGLATMRGARVGVPFAEAFELVNPEWYKFTKESAVALAAFVEVGS